MKENTMLIKESYWYNYRTDEYECIETPSDFTDYIPQSPSAQALYRLYIDAIGDNPLEAARKVLEASIERSAK